MIKFITTVFNDKYVMLVKAWYASVKKLYPDSDVQIYYHSISDKNVSELPCNSKKVGVNCQLQDRPIMLPGRKLHFWEYAIRESTVDNVVFMDCDMILRGKIDHYFKEDFDILYTYKTEEDEGIDRLLNTGIILAKKSQKTIDFIEWWRKETDRFSSNKTMEKRCGREWGAVDQAIIGRHLGVKAPKDCEKIVVKGSLKFKGVPCKVLNETRCVPLDKENPLVIHYKTRWHPVLPNGDFHKTRPKEKCLEMYNFWMENYKNY